MSVHFFTSVEFYVILSVIAAAIVALACRPADRTPAEEYLLAGDVEESEAMEQPVLRIQVGEGGVVRVVRTGLEGLSDGCAVSMAVKVIGTDVMIEERIVPGRGTVMPMCSARFMWKFLREGGRYHIKYNSQPTGLFAAFPLSVIEGLKTDKELVN